MKKITLRDFVLILYDELNEFIKQEIYLDAFIFDAYVNEDGDYIAKFRVKYQTLECKTYQYLESNNKRTQRYCGITEIEGN